MSDSKNNNDLATPVSPALCNVTQPELANTETATGWTHLVTGTFFIGFRKRNDLKVYIVSSCSLRCMSRPFPAELIKAGGSTIRCAIHKLIIAIWNKEELPGEWKESIIVPIHKKVDKTDCNNYRGISLLPNTYKVLSNILLSRLTPYAKEVIGDHQCGFRRNRSTTDHIFCIRQILEKNGNTMKRCIGSL